MEKGAKEADLSDDQLSRLRDKQRRLLSLLADGASVGDAARVLHISRRTAVRRLAEARAALGATSNVHAVWLAARDKADETNASALSAGERQVLKLVASGLTSVKAAQELSVAPSTIDSLVKSAMAKLDARTRAEAAARLAQFDDEK